MRSTRRIVLVGLLVATFASPASAHPVRWEDRDQTESPEREMEIRSVVQRHPRRHFEHTPSYGKFVRFDVQTFEHFDNSRLDYWETEHWALVIGFNLDDDSDFDRVLYVDAEPDASGGHTLYGVMTAGRQRADRWSPLPRVTAYAHVSRPATDTVRVEVPASAVTRREGGRRFGWEVRTVWSDREDAAACGCTANSFDYAPANGPTNHGHV